MNTALQSRWQVYIILCTDNSLYTGISTNAEKRFLQHKNGHGAKYFRGHEPLELIYLESAADRSTAIKKETKIKRMKRDDKLRLISSDLNEINEIEQPGFQIIT